MFDEGLLCRYTIGNDTMTLINDNENAKLVDNFSHGYESDVTSL